MVLDVTIQMDPVESIDSDGDSTFALGLEAQKRGHHLTYYMTTALSFKHRRLTAHAHELTFHRDKTHHFKKGRGFELDLAKTDVVLMRQDPPFDMAYITATHLLEHVHPETLVVNDPGQVRNAPEKLFVTHFPDLMPPTLITSRMEDIRAFREEHLDIIIKPLYGNGGAGVFHLKPEDENLASLLEVFTKLYREPVIIQRYLPEVRLGDKRIVLVDGKPVGAINRVPADGEVRSNMHVGGRAMPSTLTPREEEICAVIGPTLSERGLIFVGIDVIGDYLTEINVTSPTGIQQIERFDGTNVAGLIWDAIEARL